jgi:hypothetical protein
MELYNLRHSSLRVTVERATGALKSRFRILDNKPFHKYTTQVKLVVACAILHNYTWVWANLGSSKGAPRDPSDYNGSMVRTTLGS